MRPRITFANVVSVIALFVALGGTAIATHPGGQNTISTADIINGQVKTADIGDGEVTVADVGQGAVKTAELANGEVKAADIGQAAVGADELASNSVRAAEIATGAVRTDELQDGQVQAEDLAPGVAPGASGARAWGLVRGDGALLRSKNVTAVTHENFSGIYCIDPGPGINPNTAVMLAGEDIDADFTSSNGDNFPHPEWDSTPSDCPAGEMEVVTFLANGDPPSLTGTDSGGFDLGEFDMAFTFVIP